MRRSIMIRAVFGAATLSLATIAAAGSALYKPPPAAPQYLFCTAVRAQREMPDESIRPGVVYYSGAFELKSTDVNPVNAAFLKFLDAKYQFKPEANEPQPVMCTSVHSLAEAQTLEKTRIDQSKQGKGSVVETGWTYMPAAAPGS